MAVVRSALWKSDPIQSFIIFDAECTGLDQSKFTEICLLGVLRGDIASGGTDLPRIINKLVLNFDPEKDVDVHSTGLTRDNLSGQKQFNAEAADCLTSFVERFPKPVCLVAHNGNKFDFAVLNAHLRQISKELPKDLLCADTFKACKEFEHGKSVSLESLYKRYFDCAPSDAHKAEVNCEVLLKVVLKKAKTFLKWMDSRAVPLKSIPVTESIKIMTGEGGHTGSGIQTFVLLDAETTGLPHTRPKITELCLLGVGRRHLMQGHLDPIVGDKILLYANPGKQVEIEAARITGLNNELLSQEKPFDSNLVRLLSAFLERLPKPVCLLAHNGNRFDYPLLMSELEQVGESLPDDLLCADTLPAFRALEPNMTFAHKPADEKSRDLSGVGDADDSRGCSPAKSLTKRISFSQGEVYKRCFGEQQPKCHKAEDDCEALLKIVKKFSPTFLEWADTNAKQFKAINQMY